MKSSAVIQLEAGPDVDVDPRGQRVATHCRQEGVLAQAAAVGRAEDAVAGIAQPGNDVGVLVESFVERRGVDLDVGVVLGHATNAFGGRDDSFRDTFLAARLAPLDRGQSMASLAAEAIPAVMGTDADPKAVEEAVAAMAAIPETAYRQVLATLVTFNRREDQHRITCPCLLIAGGADDNSPPRVMEKMASRLADAAFQMIETAGHLVNSEAPEACNLAIEAFLHRLADDRQTDDGTERNA